jgi:PAS domain S-box-containing protein
MLSAPHSQREMTDQSVHESNKMLHAVVENMTEGVVISNLDGHLVHWNRAALTLHGLADSVAWSRRLDEFVNVFELSTLDGQVVPFEDWPMSRLLRGQKLDKVELRIRRRDTDWNRVMSYGGSVILDANGRELAFLTMCDVTETKRNEQALAQFNERMRILRQIDLAMIAGDAPETIAAGTLPLVRDLLGVHRAVVNLFNLTTGEVEWLAAVGRRRVHVGPGVRYSIQFMGDVEGLRRGEPQRVDVHALPRGKEVDALLASGVHDYTVVPMFAKGELIGALSFGGALTPFSKEQLAIAQEVANQFAIALTQARLYENVRRQAEELKSAFEDTDVAMVLTDTDHRFLRVNTAFARMFGYTREEILGKTMPDITHPDDIAESMAKREVLKSGKVSHFQVEKRYLHKDGHVVWGLANVSLIRNAEGQPFQYFGQVQDITERKLLEDQFRQAQKMEAVGRLAGGVAHDFNNLLTVIIGYSEIAINQLGADGSTRPLIEQIKRAGERASLLTRQLLAFSRKQILAPAVLDLNVQLADMEKMLFRLIGEDIEFHFHRAANLWSVMADAGQLEQVVMNLAINARDAMPTGGKLTIETANVVLGEPYVSLHTQAGPGEHVLLAISDTGCGMDAATKAKIFEPFFTTKHPDKGTGLGLAMVFGIVKQSGGHVEVYSEVGVGTTFKIYLPRHRGPKQAPITMHGEVTPGTETILLAEDEEAVRTLARMVLESQGYNVIQARSGLDAVQICETYPQTIHLLVTDVIMPNLNGRQRKRSKSCGRTLTHARP